MMLMSDTNENGVAFSAGKNNPGLEPAIIECRMSLGSF